MSRVIFLTIHRVATPSVIMLFEVQYLLKERTLLYTDICSYNWVKCYVIVLQKLQAV